MKNGLLEAPAPEKRLDEMVLEFKKRMLEYPNPVEYVNNMYGCHPGDDGCDYFTKVFGDR
ncbi:hypothetical protein DRJ17_02335 [Candidatus Woesearchaeota archaeon]|nr:MAG: hypothetical protein DRJ17_02335 [Candidatus Woesearchaeota archaeon]